MSATPGGIPDGIPDDIKAVIFDLDGTLVDSSAVWRIAMTRTLALACERYPQLAALGDANELNERILRPAAVRRSAEVGGEWDDEFIHYAFRHLLTEHATRDDDFAAELQAAYVATRSEGVYETYDDARRTLDAVAKRFRVALITNGPSENQRARIGPLGLDHYFEAIVVSGELNIRKPDPAIFEHMLRELDLSPAAAIYVGDNLEADIGGAHAAGMAAVWINRLGATAGDFKPGAEIATLDDLLPLLPPR
ncbi:MAG TPA: HAD family hydrolase [Dehalococcoidia bacterium]|jgi:2-haloalkanoic acid dehalogenase type II|nr:HAD family hydrolase [Dehalococcoidia bacterium]